jgi:murein L,D-transpeptidase YafK
LAPKKRFNIKRSVAIKLEEIKTWKLAWDLDDYTKEAKRKAREKTQLGGMGTAEFTGTDHGSDMARIS